MEEKNCAFQYHNGRITVEDVSEITLNEAKELWNEHYEDMVMEASEGESIEVAIWINMRSKWDYKEFLIYLHAPDVKNGQLYEPKYYGLFKPE